MKKLIKLTEKDLTNIVKKVLNEGRDESLEYEREEITSSFRTLNSSLEDYNSSIRHGDFRRASDDIDNVRRGIRRLQEALSDLERKVR